MAIQTPGKRPAKRFLKSKVMSGKFGKGRKGSSADLQLTSMVDMFTLLVIFLLANFSASGEVLFMSKEIQLPTASHGTEIERAPVVAITVQPEDSVQYNDLVQAIDTCIKNGLEAVSVQAIT